MVAKQELIDQYGHFFMLCASHGGQRTDDPQKTYTYTSRVYSAESYQRIDGFETERRRTPSFSIKEFLGKPPAKLKGTGTGVLDGLTYDDRNKSLFSTLEDAEEKFAEIQAALENKYEALKEKAKAGSISYTPKKPEASITLDLLPEEIDFPNRDVLCKGGTLFAVNTNVFEQPIGIHDIEIRGTELTAVETTKTREDFSQTYDLEISYNTPPDRDDRRFWVQRTLRLNKETGTWERIKKESYDNAVLFMTRDDAEAYVKKLVETVFNNICAHLPEEVLKKDTAPAPNIG